MVHVYTVIDRPVNAEVAPVASCSLRLIMWILALGTVSISAVQIAARRDSPIRAARVHDGSPEGPKDKVSIRQALSSMGIDSPGGTGRLSYMTPRPSGR